jgi:hypothetical protein
LEEFLATDNVVICKSRTKMKLETLFFVAFMLNREKWRYSYGRQCYKEKFAKTITFLPSKEDGSLDEEIIESLVHRAYYWDAVSKSYAKIKKNVQPIRTQVQATL